LIAEAQLSSTFGHDRGLWELAKDEARRALVNVARSLKLIEYGELTKKIQSIRFDPHGDDFRHFLGQLSWESDAAGAGMITAIVVHKHDQRPGGGFFTLAKRLGRDVSDSEKCWAQEVERVFRKFAA
jgi:hypothetical protein